MYHFLFVPLTLGLSVLVAMMETVYVMTRRTIWRDMTKFWGLLFGINFALGVATRHHHGIRIWNELGLLLALCRRRLRSASCDRRLDGFFPRGEFHRSVFFFGWDKMSPRAHLVVTWLVALGSNLSALWILIANGWMQHPVGSVFNPDTMRMEVTDFIAVLFNPTAQSKFVHTVSAGYVCGAIFVLGVSSFYILRGRHLELAKRSFVIASAFGVAASLSVIVLGDESGYTITDNQKMKLAAMEAMWHTEPAPAAITIFGIPDMAQRKTDYAVNLPWVMGLIGTRSFDQEIPGIFELVQKAESRIQNGLIAYSALQKLKIDHGDAAARAIFENTRNDLGYALLLKRYVADPMQATPAQIHEAAWSTVPSVPSLFFAFHFMVLFGFALLAVFLISLWHTVAGSRGAALAVSSRTLVHAIAPGSPRNWAGSSPSSDDSPGS